MPCLKTKKNTITTIFIPSWYDSSPGHLGCIFFSVVTVVTLDRRKKKLLGLVDTEVDSPGKNCIKCYILCYIAIDPEPYLGKYDSWNSWFQNTGKKPEKGRMRMTINYPFGEVNMFFVIFLLNLQSVVFPVILSILMICPLWGLGVNKLSSSHSLSRPSK